jgi:copper chaperone
MMETTMNVQGMTCGGCVASVTRVLQAIDGVERVDVKLDPGQARVTFEREGEVAAQSAEQP